MPKRAKNLWSELTTFENILLAFRAARLGKRFAPGTVKFSASLEDNIFHLQKQLLDKTWSPAPFRQFTVHEPKVRLIQAPAFGDRVIHHALMRITMPIFERRFIADTYACRLGKGNLGASKRLQQFMHAASRRWGKPYILKADISKYFPSINHAILQQRVERIIADADMLWLFERIIKGSGYTDYGLPIGALTSQWLANLYLDALDHFVKDDMGVQYYVRYMDDFVLVGPSKEWCWEHLVKIETFLQGLHLRLNPKTGVWPITQGVDFVGYRHWTNKILPRKRTVKRAKRTFKALAIQYAQGRVDLEYVRPRVASFTGYMGHCNGYRTLEKILEGFVLRIEQKNR